MRLPASEPAPTVVIPVFNAPRCLRACLASVRRCTPEAWPVLVIDDDSTDPAVADVLAAAAATAPESWRFLANESNRGFVITANRGMEAAPGAVILLNSDTVATPGWAERLVACLAADATIATATPWTNNGEIASLPEFCRANPVPSEADAVAGAIAGAGPPQYPDLPTAVGFCMAVSAQARSAIGPFDAEAFGRGYGEENDFSCRASAAGFRNVLCDDVYVVHVGGQSFGPLGLKPNEASMQRLLDRHPEYHDRVGAFIAADPLAERRAEVLAAIAAAGVDLPV